MNRLPPRAKRLPKASREVMGFSLSSSTLALIDRVSAATGEARGRIVDTLSHTHRCGCSICLALACARAELHHPPNGEP